MNAWWKGGRGYDATIQHLLSFRVDHIYYSKHL